MQSPYSTWWTPSSTPFSICDSCKKNKHSNQNVLDYTQCRFWEDDFISQGKNNNGCADLPYNPSRANFLTTVLKNVSKSNYCHICKILKVLFLTESKIMVVAKELRKSILYWSRSIFPERIDHEWLVKRLALLANWWNSVRASKHHGRRPKL